MPTIFLSHSSKDKFFVRKLAELLQKRGVDVLMDDHDLIAQADFLGAVLSHNSVQSECNGEVNLALARERGEHRQIVLPLLYEAVEIPAYLRDRRHTDFTALTQAEMEQAVDYLASAIKGLPRSTRKAKRSLTPTLPVAPNVKTPSRERLDSFTDLVLKEIDRLLQPDHRRPEYQIFLRLSGTPPGDWVQIFEAERHFPRSPRWARAWIDGHHVVIHCTPEALDRYHLEELRNDVRFANQKYRAYLLEIVKREASEAGIRDRETALRDELNHRLFG